MDSVGGGAFIHLCGEMTLAAASEQGVISSRHPCSFVKKPERAALRGARTLRGGEEESGRMPSRELQLHLSANAGSFCNF